MKILGYYCLSGRHRKHRSQFTFAFAAVLTCSYHIRFVVCFGEGKLVACIARFFELLFSPVKRNNWPRSCFARYGSTKDGAREYLHTCIYWASQFDDFRPDAELFVSWKRLFRSKNLDCVNCKIFLYIYLGYSYSGYPFFGFSADVLFQFTVYIRLANYQ